MIKNFGKKVELGCKLSSKLYSSKTTGYQTEVSDPTGRQRKVNISAIHKILPADFIVSCIPDEQIFARKGKHIKNPHILKEVSAIDAFLQDYFPYVGHRCK